MALPTALLTGFDAFGGASLNPSWLAVQALHGEELAGHKLIAAQLPTAFSASVAELARLVRLHKPSLVICVGQAGGRSAISLERIAINIADASIPDNDGAQPVDVAVNPKGPAAYFSTLPIKAMVLALQKNGIPAEVSQTAGTFVCNHVFYALMNIIAKRGRASQMRGGFVHVPWLPEQGSPSMALAEMIEGLRVATECALLTAADTAFAAGRVS